jgi:hypothetical protein
VTSTHPCIGKNRQSRVRTSYEHKIHVYNGHENTLKLPNNKVDFIDTNLL